MGSRGAGEQVDRAGAVGLGVLLALLLRRWGREEGPGEHGELELVRLGQPARSLQGRKEMTIF